MFIKNGKRNCEDCVLKNNKSKNNFRIELINLKHKLGGKCIECNENVLYKNKSKSRFTIYQNRIVNRIKLQISKCQICN